MTGALTLKEVAPPALRTLTPTLKHVFDHLAAIAVKGERCPTGDDISAEIARAGLPMGPLRQFGYGSSTTGLARAGYIRIGIYGHNWRVVEILAGPHAGKAIRHPNQYA